MQTVVMMLVCFQALSACAASRVTPEQMIARAEAFRSAREAKQYDRARDFLADSALAWYESRRSNGVPIVLGQGPFDRWDEHFRSESTLGEWNTDSNTVWTIVIEWNDYYRLLERSDTTRYRLTYYFNDDGLITGYMVSAADANGLNSPRADRFAEFSEWAMENHPLEWEYLRPNGTFDPTGDRAERTRKLLNEWRQSVGLPPIW
jgi:hypothetical protein